MNKAVVIIIAALLCGLLIYDIQYKPVKIVTKEVIKTETKTVVEQSIPGLNIEKVNENTYALNAVNDVIWRLSVEPLLNKQRVLLHRESSIPFDAIQKPKENK